jgi:carbonic anhydrase
MQSPIRLTFNTAYRLADPTKLLTIHYPHYKRYKVTYDPNSHGHGNFELSGNSCPTLTYNGDVFRLWQVHIHHGSEHTVDSFDPHSFEVHFVHLPQGGTKNDRKVVVGILYDEMPGYSQAGLEEFGAQIPSSEQMQLLRTARRSLHLKFTPGAFFPSLPNKKPDLVNWYHYEGSLTSFPYTENVSWFVMQKPAHVDPSKTIALKLFAEQEARGLQPLARRIVVRSFVDPPAAAARKRRSATRK